MNCGYHGHIQTAMHGFLPDVFIIIRLHVNKCQPLYINTMSLPFIFLGGGGGGGGGLHDGWSLVFNLHPVACTIIKFPCYGGPGVQSEGYLTLIVAFS